MTREGTNAVRERARRVAIWCMAGFALLQLGWVGVMPPATGIDEFDHLYRASAVGMGHWRPAPERLPIVIGRGGLLPVQADIAEASGPACARLRYTGPFNCRPFREISPGVVEIASGVDTYNPAYYAVIGTLARPFSGNAAIYAMRIVGLVLCAAAFGIAAYLTALWARSTWPLVAVLLAALPTTVYSTSLAAPNGLHMMSGMVAWSALAAMFLGGPTVRRPAFVALMLAFAVMVNTHTLGVLWFGLTAITVAVAAGLRRTVELLRPRDRVELAAVGALVLGSTFELWWIWFAQPNNPARPDGGLPGSPWADILNSLLVWPLQAVGAFPLRNEPAPTLLYAVAIVVLWWFATCSVKALRGQGAMVRAVVVILVFSLCVPVTLTYLTYHTLGVSWQGRYGMPYAVGLFLVAAAALDRWRPSLRRQILTLGVPLWVLAHLIGQLGVRDEQLSDHTLVAATHWSAPPVVGLVVLSILAAAAWLRATRVAASAPATSVEQADRLTV